jgi:Domain of unknown function (DUF4386)
MTNGPYVTSPQVYARLGGVLYLTIIVFGAFSEGFAMNRLIVAADAGATANNILASRGLWSLAVAADLVIPIIAVVGVWISYLLLRPVSKTLVLLDVFLTLVSLAVEAVSKLFLLLVLPILSSPSYLPAFDQRQLEVLANLALKSHGITFDIALVFFGCACLVEGYLLYQSRYFPRFIGVLMQIAGLCYLIACFADLLTPSLAELISPAILLPPLLGELAYCLWLLIKGVDVDKWNERTGVAMARPSDG